MKSRKVYRFLNKKDNVCSAIRKRTLERENISVIKIRRLLPRKKIEKDWSLYLCKYPDILLMRSNEYITWKKQRVSFINIWHVFYWISLRALSRYRWMTFRVVYLCLLGCKIIRWQQYCLRSLDLTNQCWLSKVVLISKDSNEFSGA